MKRQATRSSIVQLSQGLEVVAQVPESDLGRLRTGMTADIDFLTGEFQADTLVPAVAIVTESGRPGVMVAGPSQVPTVQPVELGMSNGRNTQVLSGIKSCSRVCIDLPPWAKKRKGGNGGPSLKRRPRE